MTTPVIRKRPGPDWIVEFRWLDETDIAEMRVFGVATSAEAIQEAHWSLDGGDEDYVVIGARQCTPDEEADFWTDEP